MGCEGGVTGGRTFEAWTVVWRRRRWKECMEIWAVIREGTPALGRVRRKWESGRVGSKERSPRVQSQV